MYKYVINYVIDPFEVRNENIDDSNFTYTTTIDLATTSCVINHQMHDTHEVKEKGW